jgi:acyl transferase domain-containing protein
MLASWGIRPIAVLGHSIGELVAATTAGVLRESDGPALMAARSATFERVTSGSLLAVGASPQQIARYISNDVHLAVVNGPRQVVLGGLSSPVHAVQRALRADGYVCRAVRIRQPFHTPLALPAADAFEAAMGRIPLGAPTIPIYSSALGGRVPDDVAALPRFWAQQMADPVHFWSALDAMLCDTRPILVEAGPGALLTAQARRHPVVAAGDGAALSMLPPRGAGAAHDLQAVLGVAAQLWSEGHDLRWRAVMPALP